LGKRGFKVRLSEMRGTGERSPAHQGDGLAELVCSNSLRSDDDTANAVGLLHYEMRQLDSLIMRAADKARVPAGSALAVDRDVFSDTIEAELTALPNLTLTRERIDTLPDAGLTIVATGPLTAASLAERSARRPVRTALPFSTPSRPSSMLKRSTWTSPGARPVGTKGPKPASRWIGRQGLHQLPDEQGRISGLSRRIADRRKDRVQGMGGQHPYFDGCMPIEVMAERGEDTLRFGPMKPVGLDDPRTGRWPYAVVQLRQDNKLGTLFNMVGFQTKLKYAEQTRVFRMIPGLENAEFARLGGLHRNTFLNSPTLLDRQLRLKSSPHIRFAGQITGCEGYVESASVGMSALCPASNCRSPLDRNPPHQWRRRARWRKWAMRAFIIHGQSIRSRRDLSRQKPLTSRPQKTYPRAKGRSGAP
jgi:methylenetetrahydrofolate--tRNA-(uracil-5-)-methyltransferase